MLSRWERGNDDTLSVMLRNLTIWCHMMAALASFDIKRKCFNLWYPVTLGKWRGAGYHPQIKSAGVPNWSQVTAVASLVSLCTAMTFALAFDLQGRILFQGTWYRIHTEIMSAGVSKWPQMIASLPEHLTQQWHLTSHLTFKVKSRSKHGEPDIVPKLRIPRKKIN